MCLSVPLSLCLPVCLPTYTSACLFVSVCLILPLRSTKSSLQSSTTMTSTGRSHVIHHPPPSTCTHIHRQALPPIINVWQYFGVTGQSCIKYPFLPVGVIPQITSSHPGLDQSKNPKLNRMSVNNLTCLTTLSFIPSPKSQPHSLCLHY